MKPPNKIDGKISQDAYSATQGSIRRTKTRCVQTDKLTGCWSLSSAADRSSATDTCRTFSIPRLGRFTLDVDDADDVVATI